MALRIESMVKLVSTAYPTNVAVKSVVSKRCFGAMIHPMMIEIGTVAGMAFWPKNRFSEDKTAFAVNVIAERIPIGSRIYFSVKVLSNSLLSKLIEEAKKSCHMATHRVTKHIPIRENAKHCRVKTAAT